tara:strand:+ start:464 stop:676 length:213 start_codon:yes stop_codon:yes gene_type:complete
MTTFAQDSATLHANGYEVQVLRDALSDYRKTWIGYIRDCEEGKRPNMDPEGAKMILDDIEGLMLKMSNQS